MKSKALIGIGVICFVILGYLLWQMRSPRNLSFASISQIDEKSSTVSPRLLTIPSLDLQLSILPASIRNNKWETTTKGVSYLSSSPVPGDTGNSVMYGHNWPNILGHLPRLSPGDKVLVTLSNGKTRTFVIKYTATVSPRQTSILDATFDSRLTIYTCVGFLDRLRFVVVATPIDSEIQRPQ